MTTVQTTISYQNERRPQIGVGQVWAYDPVIRKFVAFGGIDNSVSVLGETWEFDPFTRIWIQKDPLTPPSDRQTESLTYDPVLKQSIFFGGVDDVAVLEGTFGYDSAAVKWNDLQPTGTPPPKLFFHRMVYDSSRARHVLFGGFDETFMVVFNDLYELDTALNTWTLRVPQTTGIYEALPIARTPGAMAFDEKRKLTIMIGGSDVNIVRQRDTWLWDGTGWRQQQSTILPPIQQMSQCTLAYVPVLQKIVLFGGEVFPTQDNDRTWALDENGWQEIFPIDFLPNPERTQRNSASDGRRMFVFGGANTVTSFNEVWAFDGFNWNEVRSGFEFNNTQIGTDIVISSGARLFNQP